ncbi:MAG TPA: alanine--glyoxylate aminotransferase family protein [Kofleriaceae bacterium]|nr:alanine--glyoxylate aminotransferase family protein [Kofleriaceae bacterium]
MVNRAIVLAQHLVLEGGSELSSARIALLRRTLSSLSQIGVIDCCVVDGEHAELLQDRLVGGGRKFENSEMRVQVLANRTWRRASGSALLVARDFLTRSPGPCLVLRGDRPLDPEALAELAATDLGGFAAAVAIAEPPIDARAQLHAEIKVRLEPGRSGSVTAIGLDFERYDAVFTGHALLTGEIADVLERWSNPSLEDALAVLAAAGRVRARPGRIAWPWQAAQLAGGPELGDKVAALLDSKSHPAYTLLNPGPVNTTASVKSALVHHDVCHRDSNFSELMVSLTGKLRRIFRGSPDHTVCLITGSGTAAMECALSSAVPRDRKILVIDNGAFGERLHEIARLHEMDAVHLRYAWGDQVSPADVERAFEEHPDIAVVAMTHHETSVGLLNPIGAVGAICRRYDALFLVDAVSSLGAEDIDVVRDQIDICWGSANKCLHAISGVGFLCVSPRVWAKIESIKPRTYYLDLKRYRKYMDELAQTPFTPAVSNYFALDQACSEFLADGHAHRLAMYRQRNQRLRTALAALGMAAFTRTGRESHSVLTCCVPAGIKFEDLYERLKRRGYIVYACKDVLAERFMQVANMGDLPMERIDEFLVAVREVITELRGESVPHEAKTAPRRVRATA